MRRVTATDDDLGAPFRDQACHDVILGDANRIVERQQQTPHDDARTFRDRADRASEHERR